MPKLNNAPEGRPRGLERVQVGREDDVPIGNDSSLWFLWIYEDGSWDAEGVTRPYNLIPALEDPRVRLVFCTWHGQWRTDVFLMDRQKLLARLRKMVKTR